MNDRISEISRSVNGFTNKFSEMENKISSFTDTISVLQHDNKELKSENYLLQNCIDDLEQRSRNYNLEIQNIPESKEENLIHTIETLGTIIGVPIPESCIADVHRVAHNQPTKRPKNIIVHLSTRRLRNDVIAASRARRGINLGQLRRGLALNTTNLKSSVDDSTSIYINEHLSMKKKILYSKTRVCAKEKDYKFVWVKNSTIQVRKKDTTKIIVIRKEEDLQQL